jgi:hypothetical protein
MDFSNTSPNELTNITLINEHSKTSIQPLEHKVHPYLMCFKCTFAIAFSTIVFASINKVIHKASQDERKTCSSLSALSHSMKSCDIMMLKGIT